MKVKLSPSTPVCSNFLEGKIMNTNKNKMEICTLEFLGIKYFGKDITEEEIRKIDITTIFEEEMKKHIENKELINMAIIGNVTKGKSTVMLKIVD